MSSNLPPLQPPPRPHSPSGRTSQSSLSRSSIRSGDTDLSTTSDESHPMAPPPLVNKARSSPYQQQGPLARPSTSGGAPPSQSTTSVRSLPHQYRSSIDTPGRTASPHPLGAQTGHRARQHSQGFFEPSLPHTSGGGLSASQIAAQAAMHHISPPPPTANERKRSYPGLAPINTTAQDRRPSGSGGQQAQQPQQSPPQPPSAGLPYSNGTLGGNRLAAASAANAAFPNGRSPLPSPNSLAQQQTQSPFPGPPPDKEPKSKSSKMKLFSKPKNLALTKDREAKIAPGVPSPSKSSLLRSGFANASTTSLIEPSSSASSIYSAANASTSTLVPAAVDREKEKRHHFLSRQKHKLKDEPSQLALSSAHSNSQPTNPDRPQPLYSFTPDSPGPNSFSKSMSGFDLRHGGRALREKKKEEKAAAAAAKMDLNLTPTMSNTSLPGQTDQYIMPSQYDTSMGPPSGTPTNVFALGPDATPMASAQAFSSIGAQMGLPGLGPDDAWPLLKARLLNIFSGEDLRTPIEDFNMLVNVHIRRCIQRRSPLILIEDVRELLQTGFTSLSQTLKSVPEDRLVTKLVDMWSNVYSTIMPFMQAVFLPLDLEFKGRGVIMTVREAQDFWGAMPESLKSDERPSSAGGTQRLPTLGEELDVRRITLISFRDTVILPRHESLTAIFSRLSLDSINAAASPDPGAGGRRHARSDPPTTTTTTTGPDRPGTAGSLSPQISSFNSQGSTLMDAGSSSSGGAHSLAGRSRATSNTSAGSFGTSLPHVVTSPSPLGSGVPPVPPLSPSPALTDPTKVTETVARMLQCLYVLASCQTGDVGQGVVERLTGALKYNWLGRGRTGRDRRGWVGMKNPPGQRVGLVGA